MFKVFHFLNGYRVLIFLSEGQLTKETFVKGDKCPRTVFQGDFDRWRLLSKEASTSNKLASIFLIFF